MYREQNADMSKDLEKQMTHFNCIVKEREYHLTKALGCGYISAEERSFLYKLH